VAQAITHVVGFLYPKIFSYVMTEKAFSIDFDANYLGKGRELFALGKYGEAIEMYNKVLDDTGIIRIHNDILKSSEENKDQLTSLWEEQWRGFKLFCIPVLYDKANALRELERDKEAVEIYKEILTIDPEGNVEHIHGMAHASQFLNKQQKALEIYDLILKIPDPKEARAQYYFNISLYNKGVALLSLGEYQEAIKIFDEVIRIDKDGKLELKSMAVFYREEALVAIKKKQKEADKGVVQQDMITPMVTSVNSSPPGSFFMSNTFWITLVVLYLIWLAYDMGKSENHALTPQETQNSISECEGWGGRVVYDSDGKYYDCAINGRLE
jgi:tetratricopeptide (TPR) repeat protein